MAAKSAGRSLFVTLNGVEGKDGVPAVSGGDVRLIEILLRRPRDLSVYFSTSPMGRELSRAYGLDVQFNTIRIIDRYGIIGNLSRVFASIGALPKRRVSVVYSSGEHLYDVLPAAVVHFFTGAPWVALVHWVEDYPWQNKRGNTPFLHRYLYWLNRVAAMTLIKMGAKRILAVSASTRKKLIEKRGIHPDRVGEVWCGLDLHLAERIRAMRPARPKYDAVFMKRLNYGKGIVDLVEIWRQVVDRRPYAKLLIIGDGPPSVMERLSALVDERGLKENIHFAGVVHDKGIKAELLASASLFVLPSHEENWAIVIGEALACGLPVIAYDLPEIRDLWAHRVAWVDLSDTSAFANAILAQLNDRCEPELDEFLISLDWDNIARNEYREVLAVIDIPAASRAGSSQGIESER